MQLSRRSAVGLVVAQVVAATAAMRGQSTSPQQKPASTPPTLQPTFPDPMGERGQEDAAGTAMHERMRISAEKAHSEDRRKRMLADTDKLLALSTELKADIEKATRDELSLEVIRKAVEIEKLAHDVQQRMKN